MSNGTALRVASEAVMAGVPQPMVTRSALGASLVGDRTRLVDDLPAAKQAAGASTPMLERGWAVGRC